jgi:hypothetical protein
VRVSVLNWKDVVVQVLNGHLQHWCLVGILSMQVAFVATYFNDQVKTIVWQLFLLYYLLDIGLSNF